MASLADQIRDMLHDDDVNTSNNEEYEYDDDEVEVPEIAAKGKGSSGF